MFYNTVIVSNKINPAYIARTNSYISIFYNFNLDEKFCGNMNNVSKLAP